VTSKATENYQLIFSAILIAGSLENVFLIDAKKPANSREGAPTQLLCANPVAPEPLQRRHNSFTHALLLAYESTGNGVPTTPDKPANAPSEMPQTPSDEFIQSDNVLNGVELELNLLGEESM
jgi:hypothetical protein